MIGTDSQSALMLLKRKGAGRHSRHLDLRISFLQDINARRDFRLYKIGGQDNISDLFTKIHTKPEPWIIRKLGFVPYK